MRCAERRVNPAQAGEESPPPGSGGPREALRILLSSVSQSIIFSPTLAPASRLHMQEPACPAHPFSRYVVILRVHMCPRKSGDKSQKSVLSFHHLTRLGGKHFPSLKPPCQARILLFCSFLAWEDARSGCTHRLTRPLPLRAKFGGP